jgi:hypothetical protein
MVRPEMRIAVRFRKPGSGNAIQKARDRFPGAGFEILAMMTICR